MIELTCLFSSLVGTGLIAYFSGYFNDLGWLWKVPLVFVGLFFAVLATLFLTAFIVSLFINVNKPIKKPSKAATFVYHVFLSFIDRFFRIKFFVEGAEKIPDEPCVFIMNHRSNFDPMLLADRYKKKKILMISKPSNFKKPIAGGFIHKAGYMSVDRDNDREALKTVVKAVGYLRQGYSIGVYPEGKRNKDGLNLLEFRHGAFKIATKAEAPIVVTVIHESQKVKNNFPLKSTKVYLHVLKTLYPADYAGKNTSEISDEVFDMMQKDIDAFRN